MAPHDDASIANTLTLARAVRVPEWITVEDGRERLTSACFLDGINFETSCFILEEVGGIDGFRTLILPNLEQKLGAELRFATIAVASVRSTGLWIYRKPEEFDGNAAHVVVCASGDMSRPQYKKRTRELAGLAVLHPMPSPS